MGTMTLTDKGPLAKYLRSSAFICGFKALCPHHSSQSGSGSSLKTRRNPPPHLDLSIVK
jgi:hypothetical protein